MIDPRIAKLIIACGTNGTGKTTLVRRLATAQPGNVLVITPDYQEWTDFTEIESEIIRSKSGKLVAKYNHADFIFEGSRRLVLFDSSMTAPALECVSRYVTNTFVIFDDSRAYIDSKTDIDMKRIYVRRRQMMNDICIVGHGFTEVPPRAFTFANDIVLFKTVDSLDTRKPYLKDFERMKEAQARVNKKAEDNRYYFEIIKQQ